MKFKVGDKARIISNDSIHGYEIGTIVTIIRIMSGLGIMYYIVSDYSGKDYYVKHGELKSINLIGKHLKRFEFV